MSASNQVVLIGNLGADPDLRYVGDNNRPVATLRLATNKVWKDRDGKAQKRTDWHRVVVWGKNAENAQKYLAKGRQVLIKGELTSRSYEVDGEKRWITEVVADPDGVKFLGGNRREAASSDDNVPLGNEDEPLDGGMGDELEPSSDDLPI